ncbi:hypothetical protein [Stieleria varia]|nr:hypothetical protein [Stieleria varia]
MAEPIGVMERYALTKDREAVLAELIPGSDDYFFYHCLYYQTSGQLEKADAVLADWLKSHQGRPTDLIDAMTDRQRLLTYQQSPQRTIDHLINRLGVNLDHSPPIIKGERRFPSRLDDALLNIDTLVNDALRLNDQLKPVGMRNLAKRFLSGKTAGLSIGLTDFLKRVDGPYIDDLDQLVIRELSERPAKDVRFGDLSAHNQLTGPELDAVAAKIPAIKDDNAFVSAKLARLRPSDDTDLSQQPAVRHDYLQRVEAYVRTLPASYNSLKASATYRLLESNLRSGQFDQALFLRYLQLPRNSSIVHPEWIKRAGNRASLTDDFTGMALLPPVGDEHHLVRAYLEHFLQDAADTRVFDQYIDPAYLRRVFAETKLMAGVGDPNQWYDTLSAEQRQAIRDAMQLTLSVQIKERFGSEDPTELLVDIKNIDELVIRIYEINTLAYYRSNDKALNTDIDLDGLVATHQQTLKYTQPAVQRHRERIRLDEVTGRGVWVVDLVGKGLRARAMIRRGEIHHVDQTTADGMQMTVLDENNRPIADAKLIIGSQELEGDDQGRISIAPIAQSVARTALLSDGKITTQVKFQHLVESYQLSAGMLIDRTMIQTGGETDIVIRPQLKLQDQIIAPSTLSDIKVRIEAVDLDGIATTREIDDLKLDQNNELLVPIRIPPRLVDLKVTLEGQLVSISDRRRVNLSTQETWEIAGIRRSSHTLDTFLTRDGEEFVIHVLGRTGEPIPGAAVSVALTTEARNQNVDAMLQSDEQGKVRLGKLDGVTAIRYGVVGAMNHQQELKMNQVVWPSTIHLVAGDSLRLPLAEPITQPQDRFRLLELREQSYHSDRSDQLRAEDGLLSADKLPAGDYLLMDRDTNRRVSVVVVDGIAYGNVVAGRVRHRELSPAQPFSIKSIQRGAEEITVQLSGDFANVRVHLIGSRYFDSVSPLDELNLRQSPLSGRGVSLPRCGYVSDLRLGDEYRYVLRRRYADKYPGVMLPQVSVLLNPWETEETSNASQSARRGDAPPPSAAAPMADAMMREMSEKRDGSQVTSSDFDFQADAGTIMGNLRPDANGMVKFPAEAFKDLPLLRVLAADPANIMMHTIATAETETPRVDLRLPRTLTIDQPMSFERAVSIVSPDQPLDLASLGSAQLQVYGDVASLMKLYQTLISDSRFAEFQPLAQWHQWNEEQKVKHYAALACHETHLFLWVHDREFFDKVIRPYLANKKEKQFMDHWLLESDLTAYAELWRYFELNTAERALLALRLPSASARVQRELANRIELIVDDHAKNRNRIESALRVQMLAETTDTYGFEKESISNFGVMEMSNEAYALGGIGGGADRSSGVARKREQLKAMSQPMPAAPQSLAFGRRLGRTAELSFYQDLDSTKQWAESQWDRVRTVNPDDPNNLITVDPFWLDIAKSELGSLGVSSHLLGPVENRHAALVALALSGLPLQAGDISLPAKPETIFKPEHAVAIVTKRLKKLADAEQGESILVGQRFQRAGVATPANEVPAEPTAFLPGVAYQGQTVISNPTAARRTVDVFWQIPSGSIPLAGSQSTDSQTITLEPYAVQSIPYQFYFPATGDFQHYPATVSEEGELLARGGEKSFQVVEQIEDEGVTWESVARDGTAQDIQRFLADANLFQLDWSAALHRMKEPEVYQVIIKTLDAAGLPIDEMWAYSLKHRDVDAIRHYLSICEDLVSRVGPVLDSTLLSIDPIVRRTYEHLEYSPLVRARIHRLGDEDEILNPTFLRQYQSFVRNLGFHAKVPDSEKLALTYYLLIQNRITEAIDVFAELDRDTIDTKLQFDYAAGYLAMHRGDFESAQSIARRHAQHPILRWRQRFGEMQSQLQQRLDLGNTEKLVSVEAGQPDKGVPVDSGDLAVMDRERNQADASVREPSVIVNVAGDVLRIDHRNTKQVTLNLYGVDLELLFSKAPFVRGDLKRIAMVRPMHTDTLELDTETGVSTYPMDERMRRQTLLVEVVSGASRSVALFYGGELTTYVSEGFGQLQVTDAVSHRPVSTAYVKVYAKYPSGEIRFYKDGYTDSRGRFDYTSVSAGDAKGAQRYAILVLSDEKGATLHDVAAPGT